MKRLGNDIIDQQALKQRSSAFVDSFKVCARKKDLHTGEKLHGEVVKERLLQENAYIATAIIHMYGKCGSLSKAQQVLQGMRERDEVCWNALISGYANNGQGREAIACFQRMRGEAVSPDEVTFACILKSCGKLRAIAEGKRVHEEIASKRLLRKSIVLGNALLDMYAKCSMVEQAERVLGELPLRNVVSWSTLMAGYVQIGRGAEALACFERMQREGIHPNEFSYACTVRACASIRDIGKGAILHQEIVNGGFTKHSAVLGNALVDMYARCGQLARAQQVLDGLSVRDVVSWSALIAGYARDRHGHEAIGLYDRMCREGLSPDEVTFTCVLNACGHIRAFDKGQELFHEISNRGLLDKNIMVGNALVDMFCKCGALGKARQILEGLPLRNVVSWSSLIAGYAQEGQHSQALTCFSRMQAEGLSPDNVAFLCILSACSRCGELDVAQTHYESMSRRYGILPQAEHHTCMVSVFGRVGCFEKVMSVIETMPPGDDHPSVWLALLQSCRKWGNVKLGRLAFDRAIQIDHNLSTAYVLMCDVYATAGMSEDAMMVETMRMDMERDQDV